MNLPLFVCEFFEANIGLPWLAEGRSLLLNQLAKNRGKVSRFLVFVWKQLPLLRFHMK